MALGTSRVTRGQFKITDAGITHEPTGYSFTPYPGSPFDGTVNEGQLGYRLPSGEDYRPADVHERAVRLWAEYVKEKKLDQAMPPD
jgi:hypothetical protein